MLLDAEIFWQLTVQGKAESGYELREIHAYKGRHMRALQCMCAIEKVLHKEDYKLEMTDPPPPAMHPMCRAHPPCDLNRGRKKLAVTCAQQTNCLFVCA